MAYRKGRRSYQACSAVESSYTKIRMKGTWFRARKGSVLCVWARLKRSHMLVVYRAVSCLHCSVLAVIQNLKELDWVWHVETAIQMVIWSCGSFLLKCFRGVMQDQHMRRVVTRQCTRMIPLYSDVSPIYIWKLTNTPRLYCYVFRQLDTRDSADVDDRLRVPLSCRILQVTQLPLQPFSEGGWTKWYSSVICHLLQLSTMVSIILVKQDD